MERAGDFQFELRYAAAASRPVKVFLNSQLVKADAASKVTGSWSPESQTWSVECFVLLNTGRNTIRLEQPQFFPHIDKLLLTPIDPGAVIDFEPVRPASADASSAKQPRLVGSLTQQWLKNSADVPSSDPKSILTAWHQFVRAKHLTIEPSSPENGVARLLGEMQPVSLADLAIRYERIFSESQQAWAELKASDAGKDAKSLPDPVLDAARALMTDPKGPFAVPADIEESFSPDVTVQLKADREELSSRGGDSQVS